MRLKTSPKKMVLFVVLLVLAGLAMGVAVARAATPTITDTTTPPPDHFTGACSGCHLVTPTVPEVPGVGTEEPGDSEEASEALEVDEPSDEASDAVEVDEPGDHQGENGDVASPGHDANDEQADSSDEAPGAIESDEQDGQDANGADEHETVAPNVHERDQGDDESSETRPTITTSQHPRSSDRGDAGQQDGHHEAGGSSD
jgi:hypothetical protein